MYTRICIRVILIINNKKTKNRKRKEKKTAIKNMQFKNINKFLLNYGKFYRRRYYYNIACVWYYYYFLRHFIYIMRLNRNF